MDRKGPSAKIKIIFQGSAAIGKDELHSSINPQEKVQSDVTVQILPYEIIEPYVSKNNLFNFLGRSQKKL